MTRTCNPEEKEYILSFLKEQKGKRLSTIMADFNKNKHYVINKIFSIASENGYKVKNLYSKHTPDPLLTPKKVSEGPIEKIPRKEGPEPSRIKNGRYKCLINSMGVEVNVVVSAPTENEAIVNAQNTYKNCTVLSVQELNRKQRVK